jgi:hypothetical protein
VYDPFDVVTGGVVGAKSEPVAPATATSFTRRVKTERAAAAAVLVVLLGSRYDVSACVMALRRCRDDRWVQSRNRFTFAPLNHVTFSPFNHVSSVKNVTFARVNYSRSLVRAEGSELVTYPVNHVTFVPVNHVSRLSSMSRSRVSIMICPAVAFATNYSRFIP